MAQTPESLRDRLTGFAEPTVVACLEFKRTGSAEAFEQAFAGLIQHHLANPPADPVSKLPGSTRLVADLGLDSLTMVEMAFLFEDLFGVKLPHEDYVKVVTLDDLRALLCRSLPTAPRQ